MNKLKLGGLFVLLSLAVSCSSAVEKMGDTTSNRSGEKTSNRPIVNLPKDVKNARAQPEANDEKAVFVTVKPGAEFFVGGKSLKPEEIFPEVDKTRARMLSPVFINADANATYGDLLKVFHPLRGEVKSLWLLVQSADGKPMALEAVLPDEPKPDEPVADKNEPPPPPGYGTSDALKTKMIVTLGKDGKMKLINDEVTLETLKTRLAAMLKDNETKKVYREGTQDVYKTVTIKAPRSARYAEVIKILDEATGAGADPVYLQIDDLID
jgi:biopolymer transport protein ExbD